jgi:hypothetical protein
MLEFEYSLLWWLLIILNHFEREKEKRWMHASRRMRQQAGGCLTTILTKYVAAVLTEPLPLQMKSILPLQQLQMRAQQAVMVVK